MRQPNRSLPGVSRPVEVLWPNIYNRAALDVKSTLPLSISLNNLRPMVFNLPQLRQAMTEDGGLEALIEIMSTVRRPDDPDEVQVRRLAQQSLAQFGIRGPESIRVRTVEAQIVPVLITILEMFYRAMEQDIREGIEYGLLPPATRNLGCSKPMQVFTRRRAVTLGSASTPPEGLIGLQIRLGNVNTRSPLSRLSAAGPASPETPTLQRRSIHQDNVTESDRDRMDVDSQTNQEAEDEAVTEDTMTDAEALRSPPPEVDATYSSYVAGETRDSVNEAPVSSPRANVQPMEIDETHDITAPTTTVVPEHSSPSTSQPTTDIPSSPSHISDPPAPPNAPLLPYAVPPNFRPNHDGSPIPRVPSSSRRISSLHMHDSIRDLRIPRSEDVIECLETLAYLSKYPKLRAYFNSTRFVPELLEPWAYPDDATKQVNVFEIVERFTFTKYHPETVCFWASIVMRHYSRKDDVVTKRQCGNLQCRKWESDEPGMKFICCPKCK